MDIFEQAKNSIIDMEVLRAEEIVKNGLSAGIAPFDLMSKGFIPGIVKIGDLFERGKVFLPELVQGAEVMEKVSSLINRAISVNANTEVGVAVIGTVKGDVHDIGKSIVVSIFQANGLKVFDLGRDVSTLKFVEKAVELDADVIGTSALLTTTMQAQKDLEDILKKEGLKEKFITIVGGAPITERWARRIGADAYAENAIDGVNKVLRIISERKDRQNAK